MGPIKYDAFFPFQEYEDAINKLTAANKEFGESLKKVITYMQQNISTAINDVKTLSDTFQKVETNSQNFAKAFSYANEQLDQAGVKISTYKKAQKELSDTIVVAEGSVTDLTNKLKTIKTQYESLNPEVEGNKEIMAGLIKQYGETARQVNILEKELKASAKEVKAAEGSYTSMSNKLTELKKRLKDIPGAFDEMTGAINETNPEVKELVTEIGKYDKALKAADATMGNFNRNVGNYEGATQSLKQQLRNLVSEMARMKAAGEDDSDKFNEMAKKAGELKLAIADANDEIKYFGQERQNLQGAIGLMEGVAGASAAAEGAMALFGVENASVEETIKKLVAIQTIMNGVNQIGTMLEKESAAMMMVTNAQKKIGVLITNLQAAAESKNIIVRKSAIAAQWLLNQAMLANPAGILILTVAALAGAVLLLSRRTKDAAEEQIKLNAIQKRWIDDKAAEVELKKMSTEANVNDADSELKLAKAKGASQLEIIKLEEELLKLKWKASLDTKLIYGSDIRNLDALVVKYKELKTQIDTLQSSTGSEDKKGQKKIESLQGQADNILARIKAASDAQENAFKAEDELDSKRLEKKKLILDLQNKSEVAFAEDRLLKSKELSQEQLNANVSLIQKQRDIELQNINLTAGERKKIIDSSEKEIEKLKKEYAYNVEQSSLQASISVINEKLSYVKIGSDEELKLKEQLIDEQSRLDILSVNNSIMLEGEKVARIREINAMALADKKALEREKLRAEYENNQESIKSARDLEKIKAQITLLDSGASKSDKKNAANVLSPKQDLLANERQQADLEANKAMFASTEEYEKAKTELVRQHEEIRLGIIQQKAEQEKAIRQGIVDTLSQGINALGEISKNDSDARISNFENEKSSMLALAGDDKEKQFKIEQEYSKKIGKEKQKQAKVDRAIALFNIGIQTAMAVMRIWAEVPKFDFGISTGILTALAITQGAIQAAVVLSKPIPAYRKGTKNAPEGPAIVNDEPGSNFREMIVSKKGAYIPQKRNQLVYLQKGDKVMTAAETRGIFSNMENVAEMKRIVENAAMHNRLSNIVAKTNELEKEKAFAGHTADLKKELQLLRSDMVSSIDNITIQQNTFDEKGYRRAVKKGNTTTTYLNEKHSL